MGRIVAAHDRDLLFPFGKRLKVYIQWQTPKRLNGGGVPGYAFHNIRDTGTGWKMNIAPDIWSGGRMEMNDPAGDELQITGFCF